MITYVVNRMKKTLVIHPKDDSTDFLKGIYADLPGTIVIDFSLGKKDLKTLIGMCHRIIMLGHGSSSGLFDSLQKSYLVDGNLAGCLRDKECIGIWCYASEFAKKYSIPGFWSGMYISEIPEIDYVPEVKNACTCISVSHIQSDIENSNFRLTSILSKHLESNTLDKAFDELHGLGNEYYPVTEYNLSNIQIYGR